MKISGIYIIENLVNGKVYIGSSKDVSRRKREHFKKLRGGNHGNKYLQRSFDKHGEEMFYFKVVEEVDESDLINKEILWINRRKSNIESRGYNLSTPMDGGGVSTHHKSTIEILRRLSFIQHHNSFSESDYQDWLREKEMEKQRVLENKDSMRIYMICNKSNNIVGEYKNQSHAERECCDLKAKGISKVLNGSLKTYKGFVFVKVADYNESEDYRYIKENKEREKERYHLVVFSEENELVKISSYTELSKELGVSTRRMYKYVKKKKLVCGFKILRIKAKMSDIINKDVEVDLSGFTEKQVNPKIKIEVMRKNDNEVLITFNSISSTRGGGFNPKAVSRVVNGQSKSHDGYVFVKK